jgi:hypothetical protein
MTMKGQVMKKGGRCDACYHVRLRITVLICFANRKAEFGVLLLRLILRRGRARVMPVPELWGPSMTKRLLIFVRCDFSP